MSFVRFGLLLVLILLGGVARADGGNALINQARAQHLAQHPYWMKLMHYRQHGGGVRSDIVSPEFFLAGDDGAHDPAHELEATLKAFFQPAPANADEHAQCRFVARYKWLREVLDWSASAPPEVVCAQYAAWSKHGQFTSVSLIFASGFFSNPASYYGHLLLKFNTGREKSAQGLLDESLNFGAIVPDGESALVYVSKGIFGGYDAVFSSTRFYQYNHTYAENELRDMWEYELALSGDEVDRIAAHSWELLRVKFTYYFAKENCAYRMSELLGLVVEQPLLEDALPWSMPSSVFDHLVEVRRNGAPLVRAVRLIPSRLHSLHAKYDALDGQQQQIVREWQAHSASFSAPDYAALPAADKVAVVDALLDYIEFRRVDDSDNTSLASDKRALLIERSTLPVQSELKTSRGQREPLAGVPPHNGPLPNLIRTGASHNTLLGDGLTLQMRPAYFDSLALDAGRIPHTTLTMFDFNVVYLKDKLSLRSLDLVNIGHLNLAHTPLPGDGGWAWKVKFGFESQDLSCVNCTVFNLMGGLGKAVAVADDIVAYGMLETFVQTPQRNAGTLGISPRLGVMASPLPAWKTALSVGKRRYLNGAQSSEPQVRWENRFGTQRAWDIRLNYERFVAQEMQLAVSLYW